MGTWWGENDVVEDEDIDIDVCVAADGDLWVSVGSAGAPIGKFSVESEHDLANMVTDFLENAGSFGADSWCSSDSESCLSDFSHLAEKIQGAVMIPKMFSADFRHEIYRFATLVDPFANQFEVLVEKINNNIYLTHDWYALKDFYNINRIEAWVTLVYTGRGQFGIILRDRFRAVIDPPKFEPPMKFKLDKSRVGSDFVAGLLEDTNLLSYTHEIGVDDITFEKKLTAYDITTEFLMVPYEEFGEKAFKKKMTTIEIVNDCGNIWKCILICGSFQYKHYKIGGEWKRLVAARRIDVGDMIKLHCDVLGKDDHLYIKLNR